MKINKNNNELKIFMFTVQSGRTLLEVPEDFKAVVAYNRQDAFNMIRKDYPRGKMISIKQRAQVDVRKIIDVVELDKTSGEGQKNEVILPSTPKSEEEIKEKEFINGMLLISDKFVKSTRDKASLKRIINKIKLHENKPAHTTKKNIV